MDQLIEVAQVEHDLKKRRAALVRWQQLASEELPVLDLFEPKFFTLASKRVQNHTVSAEGMYSSFAQVWLKK
jgi:peptide/nickel transport system substrate-binding protein